MAGKMSAWGLALALWAVAGCGQVTVAAIDNVGDASVSDTAGLDGAPRTDIAAPQDSTTTQDSAGVDTDDAPLGSECLTDYDCAALPGKTACTLPHCLKGLCVLQPQGAGSPCKNSNVATSDCTEPRCDENAACVATSVKDGTACGIGSCGQKCLSGQCVAATAADYQDGNPCTLDYCDQGVKVVHEAITDPQSVCDDGNACTAGDSCLAGKCAGKAASCDDLIDCTTDSCDPAGGCSHTAVASACDDSNPCRSDGCDLALGCTHTVASGLACSDGNSCTTGDTCVAGACTGTPSCGCQSDADCATASANLCLGAQTCQAGYCKADPSLAVVCTGATACAPVACEPSSGKCATKAADDGTACNDGNACTQSSACKAGACLGAMPADCDDKNPCTTDSCDPVLGCQNTPGAGVCSDGNVCTSGDVCQGGVCLGSKIDCNDGVACTVDSCDTTGTCVHVGTVALCDDGNPCTSAQCDPLKGCKFPADDGATCDDGDPCTTDSCKGGQCSATFTCACKTDSDCNDNNPCTQDACKAGACVITPASNGQACDTGDKCQKPSSGQCQLGSCVSGNAPIDCPAPGQCATAACNPSTGQCLTTAKTDGTTCNADDNGCTQGDACAAGACVAGKTPDCSAANSDCTVGTCSATGAGSFACDKKPKQAGTTCSDGLFCTNGDACDGQGACKAGAAVDCSSLTGACSTGSCDESAKQCVSTFKPASTSCSDGLVCTTGDHCDGKGGCAAGTAVTCTGTACAPASCVESSQGCKTSMAGVGSVCDDSNACTQLDACNGSGLCVGGSPKLCSGDACHSAACDSKTGKCVLSNLSDGTVCSDGNPCTLSDACVAGTCTSTTPVKCSGNACNTSACDPTSGSCKLTPVANGTTCDDSQACTTGDKCSAGTCASGIWTCSCTVATGAKDCNDSKACTDDSCVLSGTTYICQNKVVAGKVCDDANACTSGDLCSSTGTCAGSPVVCNDGNVCTLDQCDASGTCVYPVNAGAACSDGSACTAGDACTSTGKCAGKLVICDDGNVCTTDSCNASTGACLATASSGACSDGNACTVSDACAGGSCVAGTAANCDDANPCSSDSCDTLTGLCAHTPNALACTDGDACTVGDFCINSKCKPGIVTSCNDGNVCTDDACDKISGKCAYVANAAACEDGNLCSIKDACKLGACYGGIKMLCFDGNPCTSDSCDSTTGACNFVNNTLACDDGSACTSGDTCSAGSCVGTTVNCNDSNVCTGDVCDPALGCVYADLDGKVCGVKWVCSKLPLMYCTPTCIGGICEKNPLL